VFDIIGAIVALGILITVHEGGHFLAARIFGVEIEKFSLGFGPKLIGFKKGKTEYMISLIPLGGYLKMKGENPDEQVDDEENSFTAKKWWQRSLIAFAGPFANFLFALFIFILSFLIGRSFADQPPIVGKINGNIELVQVDDKILEVNHHKIVGWNQIPQYFKKDKENEIKLERNGKILTLHTRKLTPEDWYSEILPEVPAMVGEASAGLPAYEAGLMKGDIILAIDGKPVDDWYNMRNDIINSKKTELLFKIKRGDKIFEKKIKLGDNILNNTKIIGITQALPVQFKEKYSVPKAMEMGTLTSVSAVVLNYAALYKLILRPGLLKENLGGPVMIYTMSKQTIKKGWDDILSFVALISILLMIMNLLPIPLLDGGQIFFFTVEAIKKKPLSMNTQMILQKIGFFFLIFLMLFAFMNDFNRIFKRNISIKNQAASSN